MFSQDPQASLRSAVTGHLAPAGRSRKPGHVGRFLGTALTPHHLLLTSHLIACSHASGGVSEAVLAPSFPQKPSCKATPMNQLGLSAALLVLLGTLVAGTPGAETSKQAQGKSRPTSPLQAGAGWEGMRRVHGRAGSRGGVGADSPLWISPGKLGSFNSRDIS